jgi:dTDP-4-amino-4,6-dideoxygalactose transaminase
MKNNISFNIPYISGKELINFKKLLKRKHFSGRGYFTKKCESFLSKKYKRYSLLTTSCTHALETVAFLLNIKKGDEIILPSYTFVSTANAFAIRGAKIIFADTNYDNPCISADSIVKKITKRTKAVCLVHYAGISCDMKRITKICKINKIKLIEDCAHAFDAFGHGKRLGTFGDFSTLSFHDTKNVISGEGGALIIKKKADFIKAQIIIEKGTNRSKFNRGAIKKYSWVSLGSSYVLSEINCSFLDAQFKICNLIKKKRIKIFNFYQKKLSKLSKKNYFKLPSIPIYSKLNGHIFYILLNNKKDLQSLKKFASKNKITLQDHYECLHKSSFILKNQSLTSLPNSEMFASRILRLPIYPGLSLKNTNKVISVIENFFKIKKK